MNTRVAETRAQLITFLGLTFGLSAILWWLIISAGSLGAQGGRYVLALMWSPGVSALITRLIFQRNVRGEGWRWGDTGRAPCSCLRGARPPRCVGGWGSSSGWGGFLTTG